MYTQSHTKETQTLSSSAAMIILVHKLGHSVKFPFRIKDRGPRSDALAASLHNFRSRISNLIGMFAPEYVSLTVLEDCFGLIKITNRALAELVDEIDYPISHWGGGAAEEYFNHSMLILNLLNSITSAASRLHKARVSVLHTLSPIKNTHNTADRILKMIAAKNCHQGMEFESEKERVVCQALVVSREISVLVLGLVLSGLCGDEKIYLGIRKLVGRLDDSLVRGLDLKFCKWIRDGEGVMEEVEDVNNAIEGFSGVVSGERHAKAKENLEMKLRMLENGIMGIEKEVNGMFSEVLGTRNKLLDNYRKSLN